MTHFRVWVAASAAVMMAGLVGCAAGADSEAPQPTVLETPEDPSVDDVAAAPDGDDGSSSDEPSSEPEPSPIPASSEGPAQNWPAPETPEEIFEPTEEGAEALLQYFYDVRYHARVTGETSPLEEVSASDCELCRAELRVVEDLFEIDGWYASEPDEVGDLYIRLETSDVVTGLYALHESDFETFLQGDSLGVTEADTVDAFGFAMTYLNDRWQMIEINYIGEYDESEYSDRI